jgi:NAD(P)-dependent dehydrogenase (short-subunit alcohol dehydrogenase family)
LPVFPEGVKPRLVGEDRSRGATFFAEKYLGRIIIMCLDIFDLTGKNAVVTGGSRGLGKAIALGLARAGANVAVVSRNLSDLEKTASVIRDIGSRSIAICADVTKTESINSMAEKILSFFDKIDILVNNAGAGRAGQAENYQEDNWDVVHNTNLKGYFLCAQAIGREMIKQKSGNIINNVSIGGVVALPEFALGYTSSKGGAIQLTRQLAAEWAKYNIRVNAICPGYMENPMQRRSNDLKRKIKDRTMLGREGKIDEIIGPVIFLASNASSYITGAVIMIDGGWTAW